MSLMSQIFQVTLALLLAASIGLPIFAPRTLAVPPVKPATHVAAASAAAPQLNGGSLDHGENGSS